MIQRGKHLAAAVLAVLCLVMTSTAAFAEDLQAVNPLWSAEKKQVKAPVWTLTDAEIAQALSEKDPALAGYDFLYVGHGEDSLFGADWNLSEQVGSWRYGAGTAQFQLTDPTKTDSDGGYPVYTTYCADIDTTSKTGWWYKVENLEDADYYTAEGAADHIRAIAFTGYWGAASGTGSLEAVKAALNTAIDAGTLTAMTRDDVAALTEGEALTATQIAIWEYGNPYEVITLGGNTLDVGSPYWDYCDDVLQDQYGMEKEDIVAALGRIDALAYYLMSLSMSKEASGETTVLGDGALVEEMGLNVRHRVGSSADGRPTYRVDLVFSLKATPQSGDDLTVQVLSSDGGVLAEGRIAPNESTGVLCPDSEGNYTLTGLTLASGDNIDCYMKLTGRQNLSRGVYVYTSEVRNEVSSQTFVGIAEGSKRVDATQRVDLSFTPPPAGGGGSFVPTVTVASAQTGDTVWLWTVPLFFALAVLSLMYRKAGK